MGVGQAEVNSELLRVLLVGSRGSAMSCLLCSSTSSSRLSSEQQQHQQQQQQQSRSRQASIGAVVGRVRVFCRVVREAVGFKKFFDRAIRSTHPFDKVNFPDGVCRSDCPIEEVGIEKALFRRRKNARFLSSIGHRPFRSTDPTA